MHASDSVLAPARTHVDGTFAWTAGAMVSLLVDYWRHSSDHGYVTLSDGLDSQ